MLRDLLMDGATVDVIEWFIVHEHWEQNQKDICDGCHLYGRMVRGILDQLQLYGLIVPTRKISKSTLYRLNPDSPLLVPLRQLHTQLLIQPRETI